MKLLSAVLGFGVTMIRVATTGAEKSPYGSRTQFSEMLGSSTNWGMTPIRPAYPASVFFPL